MIFVAEKALSTIVVSIGKIYAVNKPPETLVLHV
jgi:hypothetical protein